MLLARSSESVMNLSESEMDHKKTLQELNSRLVAYVEKVRKLQRTTDAIDSMPKQGFELSHVTPSNSPCKSYNYSEQSISVIKKKFEAELSEWKSKLDESQAVIAQLKIDLSNSSQDNKQLHVKYEKPIPVYHSYHYLIVSFHKLEGSGGSEIILWGYNRWVPFRCEV